MSQPTQALTTTSDEESMIGIMPQPATVGTAIQMMAAMADKRIATARMYPRSIAKFKSEATQLLREDIDTARSAEYAKPIGSGTVKGPSVRLAELAAMCWGNLEVEVSEPIVTDKSVIVKATAWDLQKNYRQDGIATTSILDKSGNRYKASVIETTCMATAAKARRNAILNVIPRAYINDLLEVAKSVSAGNTKPLEQLRQDWLDYFARTHKIQPAQVFELLGIAGVDDMTSEHMNEELRPIQTALKEGHATIDEFFKTKPDSKLDAVKAKLEERRTANAKKTNSTGDLTNGVNEAEYEAAQRREQVKQHAESAGR